MVGFLFPRMYFVSALHFYPFTSNDVHEIYPYAAKGAILGSREDEKEQFPFRGSCPDVPKGHPALASITMNMIANMLGLDNAATPLGSRRCRSCRN